MAEWTVQKQLEPQWRAKEENEQRNLPAGYPLAL